MSNYLKIGLLAVATTLLVWLPFVLKVPNFWGLSFSEGIQTVWKNFDGPNYIIVAKTWYDKGLIGRTFSNPLRLEYYPAHLPLYPALISIFDLVLPGPWAMLLVTILGNILMFSIFYKFISDFRLSRRAIFLIFVLLILPARFLAVRSIGSPETWFIFFILASLYSFKKQNFLLAGFWVALAQLTKSPGVLLFGAYIIYFVLETLSAKKLLWKKYLKATPLLLMPASVVALFSFYYLQTGDFLAYFHSGDNFHLFWPPFSIFSPKGKFWTGDFWLEEMIWLWLIYGLGVIKLWQKKMKVEAIFAGLFFTTTLFVAHRDVSRYILPIAPLVILAWEKTLLRKEFRLLFLILILPIFLFTWNFLLNNQSPVADWTPYL